MSGKGTGPSVKEAVVSVGEYRVNVATAGAGPTLVLLHGDGKRPGWRDWEGLLGLADRYTLLMPDLVGFGRSSRPSEAPDYVAQARVVHDLLEVMKVGKASFGGYSWGGQVALEFAMEWPGQVESLVLIASTYDKSQIPDLGRVARPTLVVWAEDDLVTQVKAGYLLRDAIVTSKLVVLPPVAKDPRHDFTYAHNLLASRRDELMELFRSFLASPEGSTKEPPPLEKELRGMALKRETPESWGNTKSS
ncbi:MAG TPA: alpha/beta fold hydrolase [Nitrososphaerales archaeon]|nr:alpha/beta fold hydrolase [Nitrososphaerales archaeon]HUK75785.1 alpha/beta fold hydrolase [Nitrososphaerales archaeon]